MTARHARSRARGLVAPLLALTLVLLAPAVFAAAALAASGDIAGYGTLPGLTTQRDAVFAVAAGPDRSVYVAGTLDQSFTGGFMLLAKYDAARELLWRKAFRPPGMTDAYCGDLAVDASGNVVIAGAATDGNDYDIVVARWSPSGDLLWTAVRDGGNSGNDDCVDVAVARNGSVYACGQIDGGDHAVVLKWARDEDPSSPGVALERWRYLVHSKAAYAGAAARALVVDRTGNVYVTGDREVEGSETDVYTVKLAANGDKVWLRSWGGTARDHDFGNYIALSGRDVCVGANTGTRTRQTDVALLRYSTTGKPRRVRTWDDPAHQADNVSAIAGDADGDVYLAVDTWPSVTTQKATLIKYAATGRRLWTRAYKGVSGDGGANLSALAVSGAGDAWIAGYLSRTTAETQWWAARYSPAGRRQWVTRWSGPPSDPRGGQAWACGLAGARSLVVAGELRTTGLGNIGGVLWLRR